MYLQVKQKEFAIRVYTKFMTPKQIATYINLAITIIIIIQNYKPLLKHNNNLFTHSHRRGEVLRQSCRIYPLFRLAMPPI